MNPEVIYWYDSAEQLPDDIMVLMYRDDGTGDDVFVGYRDSKWRDMEGMPTARPTSWAYMPKGPGK